jgi:hypothetical protein
MKKYIITYISNLHTGPATGQAFEKDIVTAAIEFLRINKLAGKPGEIIEIVTIELVRA